MATLHASLGPYPHFQRLLAEPFELSDGTTVVPEEGGVTATIVSMIRELKYDICEMPIVNYLSAREHGMSATAIPVFPTRRYAQGMLARNAAKGTGDPNELRGGRIGIAYYGNTDVTWVAAMLAESHGIKPEEVTWVKSKVERVTQAVCPPNVEFLEGEDMPGLLMKGGLDAVVFGREIPTDVPGLVPWYPDVPAAERAWFDATGIFPILHVLVVKDSTLGRYPGLARELTQVFSDAKARKLMEVESSAPLQGEMLDAAIVSGFPTAPHTVWNRSYLGLDPLHYGVRPNRKNLEMLIRTAFDQHVLSHLPKIEDLFVDSDS